MLEKISNFWPKKWPTKSQWKMFPTVLDRRDKGILFSLILITLVSFLYILFSFYYSNTVEVPAEGGIYKEGVVKSTQWLTINPLYSMESSIERDITEVVFASLMFYDENDGLTPNLAESYETEDNRIFNLYLRDDIYWSDGEKITADDVEFTVRVIQTPDFQSPLRIEWDGVEVEKIANGHIRFTLESPSAVFSENLTLKVIPKHVFEGLSPRDFRYSIHNINPVGSGSYRFKNIEKKSNEDIASFNLEKNPHYFDSEPFIREVSFVFFNNDTDLYRAIKRGEIDGYALPDDFNNFPFEEVSRVNYYEFSLPRYFSVIFNLESESAISNIGVRKSLKHSTDKEKILDTVLGGRGVIVDSPLFLSFYNILVPDNLYSYDIEKAKDILNEEGFEDGKKEPENPFTFTKDMKEESQGEEVRKLQECFIYLREDDENLYPEGEVTGFFDENTKTAVNYFQEKYREDILDPHGFRSGTGMVAGSTQKKLNSLCEDFFNREISLEVSITTLDNPMLVKTANELKAQWEQIGIKTVIKKKSFSEIQESVIRDRDFDILLFGTIIPRTINPLPLWHSSKIESPGLNLSGYNNKEADELMEFIIKEEDNEEYVITLHQKILEEVPGIFLYSPRFIYSVSDRVKGIEERKIANSSKRLENINNWYINTKRVLE